MIATYVITWIINKLIPIITKIPNAVPVDKEVIRFFRVYLVEKGIITIKEEINQVE